MGRLEQNTRAVARVRFGTGRPAMFEVLEEFEPIGHDRVVAAARQVHHHPDPAVGPLVVRVREPPAGRGDPLWLIHVYTGH